MNDETNPFGGGGDSAGTITIPTPEEPSDEERFKFYLSPGDRVGTLTGIDDNPSKAGNAMLTFSFDVDKNGVDVNLKYWCTITGGGSFKLGPCLEALKIPQGELKVSEVIGRQVILTIVDDGEYDGRKKSAIKSVSPLEDGPGGSPQASGGFGGSPFPAGPEDEDIPF